MVRRLIDWAVHNPLIVVLLAAALAAVGGFAFVNVNVEAYPDPAPAIIEVVAQYPGFSGEEVERLVTIPLEKELAGMPGLTYTRTKSLFGLSHLRCQFDYGVDYRDSRQEVINRLGQAQLPPAVTPQISPASPIGEIYRYTLTNPKDPLGNPIYELRDLKAIEDWMLEREIRRVPRIGGVTGFGGMVKRYEIHPDPDEMWRLGVTLAALQTAVGNSNQNGSGDYHTQGETVQVVRGLGLIGGGQDPLAQVVTRPEVRGEKDPTRKAMLAAKYLRDEEARRVVEVRQIVLTAVNNTPVRIDQLVDGGPLLDAEGRPKVPNDQLLKRGVVVGSQTRQGKVSLVRPRRDAQGRDVTGRDGRRLLDDSDENVIGIVLLRKGQESMPALKEVGKKIEELNQSGRLPPGVQIDTYYDRTHLINVTTETVRHNLLAGLILVSMILLMFLSSVRTAVIVAVNIPLALLFAFGVLYARGRSANLLSIGAVDFGIIVDSTVILVESIYRHLKSGDYAELPLWQRILKACGEVEKSLFYSTVIMVCALLPLFTMKGPEGQIFGPMADTYAFALAGALLLALTVSPVLCLIAYGAGPDFLRRNGRWLLLALPVALVGAVGWLVWRGEFGRVAAAAAGFGREVLAFVLENWLLFAFAAGCVAVFVVFRVLGKNYLVAALNAFYLAQLRLLLALRWLVLPAFVAVVVLTGALAANMGREFMPELEEGNFWIRGTFPVNISFPEVSQRVRLARRALADFPEASLVAAQFGRPDDGTDPTGFYDVEISVALKPFKDWPVPAGRDRPRTKDELSHEMHDQLKNIPGVDWDFSQYIRDNVMEALSGVKGENSVKIFGPDLNRLEELANQVKNELDGVPGVDGAGVFRIQGQSNLEYQLNRRGTARWGVNTADVMNTINTAVGGRPFSQMTEGEKLFDITLRYPQRLRKDLHEMLNIPVDVTNNQVAASGAAGLSGGPNVGPSTGLSPTGTSQSAPALSGNPTNAPAVTPQVPRRPLGDLVQPPRDPSKPEGDAGASADPAVKPGRGSYVRPGASTIYREQGNRFIAVKFGVRGRDLAGTVADAQEKVAPLIQAPYRTEWSGEFQEMEEAEHRIVVWFTLSQVLIAVLLYLAFQSILDALVVYSNVVAMSLGGVWALWLTGLNFNISAAVGFISILGVAVMNGLLFVSSFNRLRANGRELREALLEGTRNLVRPVTMTALAAILGLLPAAFSTGIGSQSQRPLAIVVVGGMLATLLLMNLVPVLYSLYGQRQPPEGAGGVGH
jgi:Cu/Ag efflux pump CusA